MSLPPDAQLEASFGRIRLSEHTIRIPQPLSPVHKLPYELLEKILLFSVAPIPDKNGQDPPFESLDYVFGLARVCAHWRHVTLSTPQLWTLDGHPLQIPPSSFATELFLERSKRLPFSFVLSPRPTRQNRSHKITELPQIIDALGRAAQRWVSAKIVLEEAAHDYPALKRIPAVSLERLERLDLTMSNRELPWTGPHLYVFDSAPLLRDVTLNVQGTTVGMDAEHAVRFYLLEMPWSHLTRLSLAYDNPRLCLDSVLCCPNLISATITTEQWTLFHSWGLGFQPAVLMPHLEVLDILINIRASPPGENFEPFLHRIDAPALKTLELLFDFDTDEMISVSYFTTALTRFLTQALRVERLRASNCLFSEELQIVLSFTPALTQLVLEDLPIDDALFTALQHTDAGTTPSLVPKLEILELLNVGDSYHETTLAEMIRSRWWADAIPAPPNVARLKRVKLWNEFIAPKTFTSEFGQTMKSYCAEGLQMKGLYFSFS